MRLIPGQVWISLTSRYRAIGTGLSATPEQAQMTHSWIRSLIEGRYGGSLAQATRILYGGSVKASNTAGLFSQKDIDGALVEGGFFKASRV